MSRHDDLDALLDDALEDFSSVGPPQRSPGEDTTSSVQEPASSSSAEPSASKERTLKFDPLALGKGKKAAESRSTTAPVLPKSTDIPQSAAPDVGELDDDQLAASLSKMLAELTSSAGQASKSEPNYEPQHKDLAATLRALAEQAPSFGEKEEGDKLFEQFAQQLGLADRPEGAETSGDAPSMSSFVDSIMNQLISKDVLYEPLKDIGAKYPDWLAANKPRLTPQDYAQYEAQYDYIQRILRQYDSDPDDYGALLDLLQQMQACGQPPKEIVEELAPEGGTEGGFPFVPGQGGVPGMPADCCIQ